MQLTLSWRLLGDFLNLDRLVPADAFSVELLLRLLLCCGLKPHDLLTVLHVQPRHIITMTLTYSCTGGWSDPRPC